MGSDEFIILRATTKTKACRARGRGLLKLATDKHVLRTISIVVINDDAYETRCVNLTILFTISSVIKIIQSDMMYDYLEATGSHQNTFVGHK